jgi:hypothetical protein
MPRATREIPFVRPAGDPSYKDAVEEALRSRADTTLNGKVIDIRIDLTNGNIGVIEIEEDI